MMFFLLDVNYLGRIHGSNESQPRDFFHETMRYLLCKVLVYQWLSKVDKHSSLLN